MDTGRTPVSFKDEAVPLSTPAPAGAAFLGTTVACVTGNGDTRCGRLLDNVS